MIALTSSGSAHPSLVKATPESTTAKTNWPLREAFLLNDLSRWIIVASVANALSILKPSVDSLFLRKDPSETDSSLERKKFCVGIMVHPAKPEGGCHRQRLKPLAFEWALNSNAREPLPDRTCGIIG